MFGFNNMLGVMVDKNHIENLKNEEKDIMNIYLKICVAIIEKDITFLKDTIPEKNLKGIINKVKSKGEWIEDIENEVIKYYGIEILKIKLKINGNIAIIKTSNKIRAKLFEYKGSWVVDTYLKLEKVNTNWIVKEILI